MSEPESPHIIAGEEAILARRYAHALYDLAEEKNQLDVVADELRSFREAVKGNAHFHRLVNNPRLTRAQLSAIVKQLANEAGIGDISTSFLSLLAKKRRLKYMNDIIGLFLNILAEKRGEHVVEVNTAHALTKEQQEKLTGQLQKKIGGKVRLLIKEDKNLLGGLVLKWGSRFLDASLKGKLARIERQLKSQQEAA